MVSDETVRAEEIIEESREAIDILKALTIKLEIYTDRLEVELQRQENARDER